MSKSAVSVQHASSAPPRTGFHRIVVAVGSDGGVAAVDLAKALAAPDAVMVLVRVHHEDHRPGITAGQRDASATADALRLLRVGRAALDQPCEIVVEDGADLAEALHGVAEREQADLIVAGAHRGLAEARSTLPRLLHGAPCAVAVAGQRPPDPFALGRVGIAFCTTPTGLRAAQVAGQLAERHGAELHAMHVVPVDANPWMGPAAATVHTLQRLEGVLADDARRAIGQLDPAAEPHVVEGDPAEQLARFAEQVELLVLGARSMGRLHRLVLGSVADTLSVSSVCALLVVPDPAGLQPPTEAGSM